MADTINSYLLLIGNFLAATWMGATAYKGRHNKLKALITSAISAALVITALVRLLRLVM
jgi:multisubunit Na+/H+ antiporter MnhC subunit